MRLRVSESHWIQSRKQLSDALIEGLARQASALVILPRGDGCPPFSNCNSRRPHSALDKKTPDELYFASLPALPKAA